MDFREQGSRTQESDGNRTHLKIAYMFFLTAGQPEDCVANRMGFCFSDMETSFENQHNTVSPSFNYIECYEASDPHPACDPPSQMLNDFIWNGRSIMKKEWDRIRQQTWCRGLNSCGDRIVSEKYQIVIINSLLKSQIKYLSWWSKTVAMSLVSFAAPSIPQLEHAVTVFPRVFKPDNTFLPVF